MFQCNEHVEMNKFLCSLACTWMTIIDNQFYIIDSCFLKMFHWNEMLTWWLPGCKSYKEMFYEKVIESCFQHKSLVFDNMFYQMKIYRNAFAALDFLFIQILLEAQILLHASRGRHCKQ